MDYSELLSIYNEMLKNFTEWYAERRETDDDEEYEL
jgi:hypothetical protein